MCDNGDPQGSPLWCLRRSFGALTAADGGGDGTEGWEDGAEGSRALPESEVRGAVLRIETLVDGGFVGVGFDGAKGQADGGLGSLNGGIDTGSDEGDDA
jgi:hypothetical protein